MISEPSCGHLEETTAGPARLVRNCDSAGAQRLEDVELCKGPRSKSGLPPKLIVVAPHRTSLARAERW